MTRNLTKGSPFRLILSFILPVLIGNIFQQLYNMADTFIVGHTVSSDAMAGVGSTGSVTFLVLGFASGLTAGFAVRTSQRFGARDEAGVRRSVAVSLELCLVLAALLMAIAMPLCGPLLRLMQTPEKYFGYAYWYLFVCFGGIGAIILYNIAAATLRAVGDTRAPLVILIASACLNVGLDLLFIVVFRMRYTGAAAATVLSQFLSGVGGIFYMFRTYPELRPGRADWKIDRRLWRGHIALGLPMALQFSITAIGSIIQQTSLNTLDSSLPGVVTAYTAASKISNLASTPFDAIGVTFATYAGQNYGAKEYGRIRDGVFAGMCYCVLLWAIGLFFCTVFGRSLTALFLDRNTGDAALYYEEMLGYASKYLVFQSAFFGPLGIIFVYRNTLQGIGRSALTMLAGVTELIGRAAACFVLVRLFGFTGICLSNPMAWIAADIFLLTTYYLTIRKYPAPRTYTPARLLSRLFRRARAGGEGAGGASESACAADENADENAAETATRQFPEDREKQTNENSGERIGK